LLFRSAYPQSKELFSMKIIIAFGSIALGLAALYPALQSTHPVW
jgi:hypothetical protein